MTKTHIIETTKKYDKDGKLVEKIVREETSEDNTEYPTYPYYPNISPITYKPWEPSCGVTATTISHTIGG